MLQGVHIVLEDKDTSIPLPFLTTLVLFSLLSTALVSCKLFSNLASSFSLYKVNEYEATIAMAF
jgi:hypothetical protein